MNTAGRYIAGIFSAAAAVAALSSCDLSWKNSGDTFSPHLVVEGWIYDNDYPRIIVSQAIAFDPSDQEESIALRDVPVRWAKVTVSDGVTEEVMVGRVEDDYFPPFVYSGSEIIGKPGGTYTLKVEYSGETLTGTTTIPEKVEIEDISYSVSPECDTLYSIELTFRDRPGYGDKYKIFVKSYPEDSRFYSAFFGTFSDEAIGPDGIGRAIVYRSFHNIDRDGYTPYFRAGETVEVMLARLPESGFNFWIDYENDVTNGRNPMFPSVSDLRSNVSGGVGIWCGYAVDVESVRIESPDGSENL